MAGGLQMPVQADPIAVVAFIIGTFAPIIAVLVMIAIRLIQR